MSVIKDEDDEHGGGGLDGSGGGNVPPCSAARGPAVAPRAPQAKAG